MTSTTTWGHLVRLLSAQWVAGDPRNDALGTLFHS